MRLLVTMAVPKPNLTTEEEGQRFAEARIEVLDWESKECLRQVSYQAPPENLGEGYDLKFTGGCPYKGQWFQASGTELVIYDMPDWTVNRVISYPSFHDLHGVAVIEGEIAVVNTGLEMIQFMDFDGAIVREANLARTPTWERFDRGTDYRRVRSTKPHEVHINHAFRIDGQWWTTRCIARDAVNIDNPQDRIDIAVGQPHDGVIRGDFIHFTTTNAHVVVANIKTRQVEDVIDLNSLNPTGGRIGWCRGLEVDGDVAYVAFTRLRRSKWHGVFDTVKDVTLGRKRISHIEKIDLKRRELLDSYDYERESSSALFTVMDYDRVIGSSGDAHGSGDCTCGAT